MVSTHSCVCEKLSWSTKRAEEGHLPGARLVRMKKALGEEQMMVRAQLGQIVSLFTSCVLKCRYDRITDQIPEGVVNITPQAGDIVIISELLTHGTLTWKPDRDRRTLVLRYGPQHQGGVTSIPDVILEKLLPETRELIEHRGFNHVKKIVEASAAV